MQKSIPSRQASFAILLAILIFGIGFWFRYSPRFAGAYGAGHDERLYSGFVDQLRSGSSYPEFVQSYLAFEKDIPEKRVSPLRSTYLLATWSLSKLHSDSSFELLRDISFLASLASMAVAGLFARRVGGTAAGLAVLALMACAPLQIFNAHRALLDGFFSLLTMLTLWSLWECLENPKNRTLLWLHGISWIPLVMAKETSFFVWTSVILILIFVKDKDGEKAGRYLWLSSLFGAAAGFVGLTVLCGGPGPMKELLDIALHKQLSDYTVFHADGPSFGYLLAIVTLSPLVSLFALAAMVGPGLYDRCGRFMALSIIGMLAPLAALPYQIVPRLLATCDLSLRWLCWLQLTWICKDWKSPWRPIALIGSLLGICLLEVRQHHILFQTYLIYEPTCDVLFQALKLVKWTQ